MHYTVNTRDKDFIVIKIYTVVFPNYDTGYFDR